MVRLWLRLARRQPLIYNTDLTGELQAEFGGSTTLVSATEAAGDSAACRIERQESMSFMEFVSATYRLRCSECDAETIARQIAFEQTVEVPEDLIRSAVIRDDVLGRVRSIEPTVGHPGSFDATIDYPAELAGTHVGQMWNLLYGNISLKRQIRLERVDLPLSVRHRLPGPRFGINGVREMLGVFQRPLLATALKPRGSSPALLAALASAFAAGGGDLVKDDHNLVDSTFAGFCERVDRCQAAVDEVVARTGRQTLYAPNLSPPIHELDRYAEYLVRRGCRAALIAPMLLGLDTVAHLTRRYPLVWLAHPTFTGCYFHDPAHGVAPGVLLGQWFRWLGCDATVFPNHGGRFTFSREECQAIAEGARAADPDFLPCWPTPAGGMSFDRLPEMAAEFGHDTQFLIGGALLGDSAGLESSTRRFHQAILEQFPDAETCPPNTGWVSACELPVPREARTILEHLRFHPNFTWEGRPTTAYKPDDRLPFRDVARTELVGTFGEKTAFDLRYFEIAPDGFSSREKHLHAHVVIGVRGYGTLINGETAQPIAALDVAYVPPLRPHQLRNDGSEPFGFLCIVDHERDRPQPA